MFTFQFEFKNWFLANKFMPIYISCHQLMAFGIDSMSSRHNNLWLLALIKLFHPFYPTFCITSTMQKKNITHSHTALSDKFVTKEMQ